MGNQSIRFFGVVGYRECPHMAASIAPRSVLRGAKSQTVSVDWLRFSGPRGQVGAVVDVLRRYFVESEPGRGRYMLDSSIRFGDSGGVFFDADEESGARHCVVDLPGSLLGMLWPELNRGVVRELCSAVLALGFKATRFDVAVDFEGEGLSLVGDVRAACEAGELCRARTWGSAQRFRGGDVVMDMVTVGQRGKLGSGRFLRVYDKGLERKSKPRGEWIRWEVEFADSCAAQAALAYVDGADDRGALLGLAWGVCDFRQVTGARMLERRPQCGWFSGLVAQASVMRVVAERVPASLEGWVRWVGRCVAPTLAVMGRVLGCGVDGVLHRTVGEVDVRPVLLNRDVVRGLCAELGVSMVAARQRVAGLAVAA